MNREEILAEAKRRYPKGTKFISPQDGKTYTCDWDNHGSEFEDGWYLAINGKNLLHVQKNRIGQYVYFNNRWAEVVDDFQLPEKWFCRASNQEENTVLYRWCANKFNAWLDTAFYGYDYVCSDGTFSDVANSRIKNTPDGFTEISFDQFKRYVLKEKVEDKKIVGYKNIKDLPCVPKGSLFEFDKEDEEWEFEYETKDGNECRLAFTQAEIDQSPDYFEPVYEVVEKELNINGVKIIVGKNSIKAEGKSVDYIGLKHIWNNLKQHKNQNSNISGWAVEYSNFIKIGCKQFTVDELYTILTTYEEINPK